MDFLINLKMVSRIYAECFYRALQICKTHGWLLLTIFAYFVLYHVALFICAPLGYAGGFILGLVLDALISSFLAMVETAVRRQRLTWADFKKSFAAYFFDVMGVLFVLWLVSIVAQPIAASVGGWFIIALQATIFILFNPVPELIYYAHHGTMELFTRSYTFIKDAWIEWFIPNLLVAALLYGIYVQPLPLPSTVEVILKNIFLAFAIYFMMIFRGLLFAALYRSSRRQRLFQYKAGS